MSYNENRRKRYADDPKYREEERKRKRLSRVAHREEINARKRRKYAIDPEFRRKQLAYMVKSRRAKLLRDFGMSWLEYELRLALQKGACAICKKKPKGLLCVDHCHRTGKVRGLLCRKCNSALGFSGDDPNLMQAGADYLRAFYESLEPRGDDMTSSDEQTETGEAGRLMREAILLELQRAPGQPDDGPLDRLRLLARKLVDMAVAGDMQAIKEVLDRIDGKPVPGPGDAEHGPRQVSFRWKDRLPSSAAS
jgi:Recombination endonuclease VII